jgi:zinc protease
LVYDRNLATSVSVQHFDLEKGGVFQIDVTPSANTPLGAIEDVVDSVVHVMRDQPLNARTLVRFKNANAIMAVASLQPRAIRADTLAQGEKWANDPVAYAKQVNAANALTPAAVQRTAVKYLTPGRLVMSIVPRGKLELASKPERKYENASAIVP